MNGRARFEAAAAAALLSVLLWSCSASGPAQRASSALSYADLVGGVHTPLLPAPGTLHVLVFVTTDCPIANSYAPELRAIAAEHADDPVQLFLVHVDPEITAAAAGAHAQDYGHELPILLDPGQGLVRATGAEVTPEAALLDESGRVLYLGRIDDMFADLGRKRRFPRERDLRAALRATLDGRPVAASRVRAVGCLVPDLL